MKKWNVISEFDINVELEVNGDFKVYDLFTLEGNLQDFEGGSFKILNVINKYNQAFPKSLQTMIDLYIKQNSINELCDLLDSFTEKNSYISNLVNNQQVLFVEYLNMTNKDFEEALDIFITEVSDNMMHTEKQLTDKREILETIIKMLHKNKSYDEIIILNDEFIDEDAIRETIIESLKDHGDYEDTTEDEIAEYVEKEFYYMKYNNPEELITYIDVDKAYDYISEYYTIIVDDNGTSIIDNYYV